jgi:3-phosphoshikimate 1-carboxyvinyltransferase
MKICANLRTNTFNTAFSPIPVLLPRSKSIVIRCLIVNYIRNGTLLPIYDNYPNDIKIVYNALQKIDLQKQSRVGECSVIDVEDCGAAYRFLMALLAATPGKWLLTGTPRLLERPILPLVNFLNNNGAKIQQAEQGWHIEGTELHIDNFEIDSSETSQFASAVMMLQSNFNSQFSILNSQFSNPYVKLTATILRTQNISHLLTLSDWSAAVFWLVNALLVPNAHYFLENLHFDNLQGDAEIVPWFEKWGLSFKENKLGIEVKHIHTLEISKQKMDVVQTPDIAMILATLSVCYPFELTLTGLQYLNLKESRRLDIMVNELSKFTTVIKHSENKIIIHKRTKPLPQVFHFDSYNDHRFVMAWSLFKNFGDVKIDNAECVKKSYPVFLKIYL